MRDGYDMRLHLQETSKPRGFKRVHIAHGVGLAPNTTFVSWMSKVSSSSRYLAGQVLQSRSR